MICATCGTDNEAGRKFCKECASRLALGCPSCDAANPADAKFCGECATPLIAGAAPATAAAAATALRTFRGNGRRPADWAWWASDNDSKTSHDAHAVGALQA